MSTRSLKKWALLLTFWVALHVPSLRAQTLPLVMSGSGSVDFEFQTNGAFWAAGDFGTGTLSLSGAGTRLLWYPGLAAFRAGYVNGSQWDSANLGAYSTAFGHNTTASGSYAIALGNGSSATGSGATALGIGSLASGEASTASGYGARAPAWGSSAFGISTWSDGMGSLASGVGASTTGEASTASGYFTYAGAAFSAAFGLYTSTTAYDSFVIGTYNVGGGTSNSWVDTDPIFEIGNGASPSAKSDALIVYKNGNVIAQGSIQAAPGGDIPMYQGN